MKLQKFCLKRRWILESPELIELRELLAQKKEVVTRLDKLKALKSKTKPHVFKKVYEDYSVRLNELNSHIEKKKEVVRKLYSQYEKTRIQYLKEKSSHEDELEESKLRHMVGEYEDNVFKELEKEKRVEINALKEKIKEIDDKMRFLKEILEEKTFVAEKSKPAEVKKEETLVEEEVLEPITEAETVEEDLEEIESILEESLTPVEKSEESKGTAKKEEVLVEEKFMDELGKGEEKKKAIVCPKCGHENPPDSYFCEECGSELIPEDIEF